MQTETNTTTNINPDQELIDEMSAALTDSIFDMFEDMHEQGKLEALFAQKKSNSQSN
jgi:hypothetical protein